MIQKTTFSVIQMSKTPNLEKSDSLVYFIGAMGI